MDNTISGVDSRRIARGTQRVRCWLRVRLGRARNSSCSLVQSDSPPRARPPPLSADSCFSLRRTKAYRSVLPPFELEPPLRNWSISSRRISETEEVSSSWKESDERDSARQFPPLSRRGNSLFTNKPLNLGLLTRLVPRKHW